jgi:uncharacterized membrane protein
MQTPHLARRRSADAGLYLLAAVCFAQLALVLFDALHGAGKHIHGDGSGMVSSIIFIVQGMLLPVLGVAFAWIARARRRLATKQTLHAIELMLAATTVCTLAHLMLYGVNLGLIAYGVLFVGLVSLHSTYDPQLALERANQAQDSKPLRAMFSKTDSEQTAVPGKTPGKGYLTLNFFNLFWIFCICSVVGLVIETIVHIILFGGYQDRAGLLWGPFSPIYGFGGLLMTIALNRFHNRPWWLIFLVSAVIGGAFEFFTSWFMQTAFGITAWNYSGTFLSIDGRTNGFFMCCWGILGLTWVKALLPIMLWAVKKIPWSWRYTVTAVAAVLMLFDGVMTLTTLDCWYLREAGVKVSGPVETFCATYYDNTYMQNRFQSMSMDVSSSGRLNA